MPEGARTAPETIGSRLAALAVAQPTAPAVLGADGGTTTFGEVHELVHATRMSLATHGYGPTSVIASVVSDGPDAALTFLALAGSAVAAPLSVQLPARELTRTLRRLCADAVVTDQAHLDVVRTAATDLGSGVGVLVRDADGGLAPAGGNPSLPGAEGPAGRVEQAALLLSTSGTTGAPKTVELTHANLLASADRWARTLQLGPTDRCLGVMPLHHVHGLVVEVLASVLAGGSVTVLTVFDPVATLDALGRAPATWVTAVPPMWAAIADVGDADPARVPSHGLRFVRSASAPLPPVVLQRVESRLEVPVLESYAMTETASCTCSNPLPPAARRPGSVGLPLVDQLSVVRDGEPAAPGEVGEVWVRGPQVTPGYRGDPLATSAALSDGWLRTGDLGHLDADGYLWLVGRTKEMVNRGGETISPREIDDVLLQHPDVQHAVTFGVPDRRLGEQVAAVVVPRPASHPTERELRTFAFDHLAPSKVPRRIVLTDDVPVTSTGKPRRDRLAAELGLADLDDEDGEDAAPYVPPRTDVEAFLAELWRDVLHLDDVGVHDRFLDVGGDSLRAALLLGRVRDEIGIEISLLAFFDAPTIAHQGALLDEKLLTDDAD